MAQLSAVIVTEDSEFRSAASDLVRASGVPIGVDDAATVDPSKPSPAIALVDGRASAGWGRVEEIRLCWPSATIIAVASESQPDHILAAMRAGANEFVRAWPTGNASPPEAALKGVHASIRKTHERLQADSPDGSQVSRVLSFFGTKGGVGTTLSR